GALGKEATVAEPRLDASLDDLRSDLQRMLVQAGLWPREAAAMVDTWRDSWFEEGTRVFYIVPRGEVDRILPLEITPAPERTARVFVGRMEVITPAIERSVDDAIRKNDADALARYGRFLGAATDRLLAKADAPRKLQIRQVTNAALQRYVRRMNVCE
ncbi:MAG: hypothetical protein ACREBE_13610, partial [bacterium]